MIKDELFDTEEKQEAAIGNFKNLLNSAGWQLIVKIIDQNIEVLENLILTGLNVKGEKLGVEESDRLRDNLALYKNVRGMPESMIESLTKKETAIPESDPFATEVDK